MSRRTTLDQVEPVLVSETSQHGLHRPADITVVIPTFRRTAMLERCLARLLQCVPAPKRILVFVDGADKETPEMLSMKFSDSVEWVESRETRGPGGGRDTLIRMADTPWVVSVDDDSWPEEADFFARLEEFCSSYTRAGALAFPIRVRGRDPAKWPVEIMAASSFENCGCAIRREAFLETDGFLPLRYAYDMEEKDVSLQLINRGWEIWSIPDLFVFHDTDLQHRANPEVNAAHITNRALLAFLRYPILVMPLGLLQSMKRVIYSISVGHWRGIARGIARIPYTCFKHRAKRRTVASNTLKMMVILNKRMAQISCGPENQV